MKAGKKGDICLQINDRGPRFFGANFHKMVLQSAPERASPASIKPLITWLSSAPDFFSHVSVSFASATNRVLLASSSKPAGTPLLRIPPSHLITSTQARRTSYIAQISSDVAERGLHRSMPDVFSDSAVLLLFLVAEFCKGADSFYAPFIRSIPITFSTPVTANEEQMENELGLTPLGAVSRRVRGELEEMYNRWFRECVVQGYPHVFKEEMCGWHTFVWAHCVVESRGFKIDGETMLVPLADMGNHVSLASGLRNVRYRGWMVQGEGKGVELYTADEGIEEGEEVSLNYGALKNWQLVAHYGFAIVDNGDDEVEIGLEVPEDSEGELFIRKTLLLNAAAGVGEGHVLTLSEPLPEELLASMRIMVMGPDELEGMTIRHRFDKIINTDNERRMLRELKAMLDTVRNSFVDEEDGRREGNDDDFAQACRVYKQGQKRILDKSLSKLNVLFSEVSQ